MKASFLTPGMNGLAVMERGRDPVVPVIQEPEDQDDNWDDDFEEGISLSKLHGASFGVLAETLMARWDESAHLRMQRSTSHQRTTRSPKRTTTPGR